MGFYKKIRFQGGFFFDKCNFDRELQFKQQ